MHAILHPAMCGHVLCLQGLTLMQAYRQQLAPVLVAMLQTAEEACPAGRAAAVPGERLEGVPASALAKEGVYNAIGTCAFDLHDFLDFPSWFECVLAVVQPPLLPAWCISLRLPQHSLKASATCVMLVSIAASFKQPQTHLIDGLCHTEREATSSCIPLVLPSCEGQGRTSVHHAGDD